MDKNDNSMIRVLHVTQVLKAAGIESFIMNNYRAIDRKKVQFDFMVLRNCEEFYDNEIASLGGKKYTIETHNRNTLSRVFAESRSLYMFLKEHPYDIIHIHYTTPLRALLVLAAKKANVKVRIYHSHSAEILGKSKLKRVLYALMRKGVSHWATEFFACSNAAAKWMFCKSVLEANCVQIVYNGIDVERFGFNKVSRESVRKELDIENNFVLIHTGRFLEQKNHLFILDVFAQLKEKCPEAKLLLLGTGDLFELVRKRVCELDIDKDVKFLGVRADVEKYLCAADCYIMPSLYEGLPVAAVEAECSGLPCVFSTNITKEVELTDNVTFLSLDASVDEWCNEILKYRGIERIDYSAKIREKGYDARIIAQNLQNFYEKTKEIE